MPRPIEKLRLTERSIANLTLADGESDRVFWDSGVAGFGIRLRAGGSRTWIYRYRIGDKQRSMLLGSAKSVPPNVARKNAALLEARVRMSEDPARDREKAKIEASSTVGALVEEYLEARKAKWRRKSYASVRRYLVEYAKPLHRLPIAEVSQRDAAVVLNNIAKGHGDVTANRARASLCAFFGWVIREGIRLPEGNVASYTEKRKETSRERVLTEVEVKRIWHAAGNDDFGTALRLLILTGQREMEIGALRWDEVHEDRILLPAHRVKNKRAHTVPLSDAAIAILNQLRDSGRAHVFGDTEAGYQGWPRAKRILDNHIAETGDPLPHWTIHDIRRSVATHMVELGVQPHIVEAVLNHVSGHRGAVAGIYNRATYDKEKRAALNLWAEHLLAVIEGRKAVVVPLRRA